jgi:hypothetical protein
MNVQIINKTTNKSEQRERRAFACIHEGETAGFSRACTRHDSRARSARPKKKVINKKEIFSSLRNKSFLTTFRVACYRYVMDFYCAKILWSASVEQNASERERSRLAVPFSPLHTRRDIET